MSAREWTAEDLAALHESRANLRPGEWCEPMIDGSRTVCQVVERLERGVFSGWNRLDTGVLYLMRDDNGVVHKVLPMDDPRRCSPDQIPAVPAPDRKTPREAMAFQPVRYTVPAVDGVADLGYRVTKEQYSDPKGNQGQS